jgi:hypothetical protein
MTGADELRLFTAEEATRALPLVRRIASDIAHENGQLRELLPELRRARIRARTTGTPGDLEQIRELVARSSARLEAYLDELRQVGCFLHEPTGVIDFRSVLDGRPVVLCWSLGEERVSHWHEAGRPHADRRPIPRSVTTAAGASCEAGTEGG